MNGYNLKGAFSAFVAGFALVACGGEKVIQNGQTLVFMGDSITQYGKERSHGYPNLVVKGLKANGIDVTWHGVGIVGNTSADMLARFDTDVIAKDPDIVTISAGVNDVWFGQVTYDQFCQNELAMIAKVKAVGAKTVLLSPTTALGEGDNAGIRTFSGGVKQIAAAEGLAYAPTFEMLRAWIDDPDTPALTLMNNSGLRATYDGVHMAPAGDRVLARATLKGLGLDADALSVAEAAWNTDDTLVPLVSYAGSATTVSVNLTAAEAQSVSGLTLKQILNRGIPSLAANPTLETEGSGAETTMTLTTSAENRFTFKAYDQLMIAARRLGIRVDEAVKCAILRGARDSASLSPSAPTAAVNDVLCGSNAVTFDATVSSVGATASACDVLLRYGASTQNLGESMRIVVGENGSFTYLLKGLLPETSYFYELTFVNNATTPQHAVVTGSFTTQAISGAIAPSGEDDTATIQAALDAAAPSHGVVNLGEGFFTLSAELMVTGGVSLVGQGWTKTTLRQTSANRVVTLNNGSRIEGITVTGGKTTANWRHGAGVLVEDGTISRCRVWHNDAGYSGSNIYGGGVNIEKGTIDHSVIAFNKAGGATAGGGGIGSYNKSGTVVVDTCLVYGNTVPNGNGGGIGFVMSSQDVTIRNTTIAGNTSGSSGGGLSFDTSKLKLVNGIVSGNTAGSGNADVNGTPAAGSSNNLIGGSPAFVDAANHDYHLADGSPAIGAGVTYTGIGNDLDDLAFAATPSIGCYEYGGGEPPAEEWDIPGTGGGIKALDDGHGGKCVKFRSFSLANGKLTVGFEAGKVDANGQTFGLLCKENLTDTETFTINVTLTNADGGEATLGSLEGLTDKPQLFILGIDPAAN